MDPKTNFALIVIQTELERYKYLVRSYLRARIAKVTSMEFFVRYCPRIIDINCVYIRSISTPCIICPVLHFEHVSHSQS